jgi:hypothetical protein
MIVGTWYGMNFEGIHELSWKYGYLMAIAITYSTAPFDTGASSVTVKPESPLPVPETRPPFHRRVQRNAFHRRDELCKLHEIKRTFGARINTE